jgi:hypothetical protein
VSVGNGSPRSSSSSSSMGRMLGHAVRLLGLKANVQGVGGGSNGKSAAVGQSN